MIALMDCVWPEERPLVFGGPHPKVYAELSNLAYEPDPDFDAWLEWTDDLP